MSFLSPSGGESSVRMRGLEKQLTEQGAILSRLASKLEEDPAVKDNDHRPRTVTRGMSTLSNISMPRTNSQRQATDVGDDGEHGPDALTHGDWIVLRDVTAESGESPVTGHLCGDSGAMRLGLQTAGDLQEHRDALNFHDFVFQVVPALNYRQVGV